VRRGKTHFIALLGIILIPLRSLCGAYHPADPPPPAAGAGAVPAAVGMLPALVRASVVVRLANLGRCRCFIAGCIKRCPQLGGGSSSSSSISGFPPGCLRAVHVHALFHLQPSRSQTSKPAAKNKKQNSPQTSRAAARRI
jgi:hypothetical protein